MPYWFFDSTPIVCSALAARRDRAHSKITGQFFCDDLVDLHTGSGRNAAGGGGVAPAKFRPPIGLRGNRAGSAGQDPRGVLKSGWRRLTRGCHLRRQCRPTGATCLRRGRHRGMRALPHAPVRHPHIGGAMAPSSGLKAAFTRPYDGRTRRWPSWRLLGGVPCRASAASSSSSG